MNKKPFFVAALIWLVLLIVSLRRQSWLADVALGTLTQVFGIVILLWDPRNVESKRAGYRVAGAALLIGGTVAIVIAIYRKYLESVGLQSCL